MDQADAPDRKTLLADAAVEVIGSAGLRALTHRAVDRRAGLPSGTCSYHYPTRRALISAILDRIAALDQADIERFSEGRLGPDMDPGVLVDVTTATLATWLGPARARSRARLLLTLDPPCRELAAPIMTRNAGTFERMATTITGDVERAGLVLALIDGLVLDELTQGHVPVDVDRLRARVVAIVGLTRPG